jgi:hypothetical protein
MKLDVSGGIAVKSRFVRLAKASHFICLCLIYTMALLAIVMAVRAQEQHIGTFQVNFEYRVF